MKKIKSEEKFCTRIMKNPSPYGSQYYEQKHINKWNGRLVSEYEAHMAASKSAWLNVVPEKISIQNLALHGTNFDVALLAMKMRVQPPDGGAEHPGGAGVAGGGQLLPVGNLLKRGGTLVTGESGARLLNLRRVSTVSVSGGLNIEKVFRTAQEYAWSAAHGRVRVNNGRSSQTPIVVIGDGMDTKKLRYHSTLSPDVGLLPGSEIGGEVAYKRLNIRGLLCQESDLDYVLQVLKEEKLNVTVNTYESFREQVEQKPLLAYMGAEGTPQRRQLLEKLMGVPLPDYPDYSEADWRKSTLSEDGDDF
ncbi:hypothetical protein [Bordetella sp. LUAb4]|uniref:hypothetical protein n=1 Tax=Bordetella sp. LUAb4 TaxID=2843195 RepID=UPI001E3B00B8|nr:hypothetical protein [Bordetella sp. LUAb4]